MGRRLHHFLRNQIKKKKKLAKKKSNHKTKKKEREKEEMVGNKEENIDGRRRTEKTAGKDKPSSRLKCHAD